MKYTITIEDAPNGIVKVVSNPSPNKLMEHVHKKGMVGLTPVQEYAAEFFTIALAKSNAANKAHKMSGKIILPN